MPNLTFTKPTLCLLSALTLAAVSPLVHSEPYSVGATFGSTGMGVNVSGTTDWHFSDQDQLQWRVVVAGLSGEGDIDENINEIEYQNLDISLSSIQGGLDWYAFQEGWKHQLFFSGGLMYWDFDIEADADTNRAMTVGGKNLAQGSLSSLTTEIEGNYALPYVSMGWGNRLDGEGGFHFFGEFGFAVPTGDVDAQVSVVDPNGLLTAEDLRQEEREIEDEMGDVQGFVTLSVAYQF